MYMLIQCNLGSNWHNRVCPGTCGLTEIFLVEQVTHACWLACHSLEHTIYSEFHSSYAQPAASIFYTACLMPGRPAVFNLSTQGETVLLLCRKAYCVVHCPPAGRKTNESHCINLSKTFYINQRINILIVIYYTI